MAIVTVQTGGQMVEDSYWKHSWFVYDSNQIAITAVHFKISNVSGGVGPYAGDFANQLQTILEPLFEPLIKTTTTMIGSKVAFAIKGPAPLPGIATSNTVGSDAGANMPGQVSGIISVKTALAGKAFRGRLFIPFPTITMSTGAPPIPTAGYQTNLDALAVAWLTPWAVTSAGGNATATPVIFHRPRKPPLPPRTIDNTGDPIVSFLEPASWATQRRRGDYGKVNKNVIS